METRNKFYAGLAYEQEQDKHLINLYNKLCGKGSWHKVGKELQDKGIDIEDKATGETYENKVVRGKYTAMTLETESCSVAGHEKDGWMKYSEADWLMYGFGEKNIITLHQLDLQELKVWFWKNYTNFAITKTEQINESICRVVPMEALEPFIVKTFTIKKEKNIVPPKRVNKEVTTEEIETAIKNAAEAKKYKVGPLTREELDEIIDMCIEKFDVDLTGQI